MTDPVHDVVIIGAGPGGYVCAIRAAQLGLNVACVEREPSLGGTCLRVGCIPSKALLESTELLESARTRFAEMGVIVDAPRADLATMMRRKDKIVQMLGKGIEGLFRKLGVTRYQGTARLAEPGVVAIEGDEPVRLRAKHIVIATGSRSVELPGVELDGDRVGTSTEALAYPEAPRHLVVIGAGYIGLELGTVWRRLGAEVTVVEVLDRILPGLDAEVATFAQRQFEAQGIRFRLGARVTSARAVDGGAVVECAGFEPLPCDRVLLAVGRRPNTAGLGLETAGVALDEKGRVVIDEGFATGVPGIYAIGDVVRGPMLAHKAEEEGIACAEQIALGHCHVDYESIPAVVYTHPEIATVGRTEEALRDDGVEYRKGVFPFRANGRARSLGDVEGFVKVLAEADSGRLLGVHIIGPRAGDLIAEAALAMAFGGTAADVAICSHAHPTLAEALKEAALAVEGRAIHI